MQESLQKEIKPELELRDQIALVALPALIKATVEVQFSPLHTAILSYAYADAMLEAREFTMD